MSTAVKKTCDRSFFPHRSPPWQDVKVVAPCRSSAAPRSHVLGNKQQPALGTDDPCLSVPLRCPAMWEPLPGEISYLGAPETSDSNVSVTFQGQSNWTICYAGTKPTCKGTLGSTALFALEVRSP